MTAPTRDDDGWNDLYAELGLDKPSQKTPEVRETPAPEEAEPETAVDEDAASDAAEPAWAEETAAAVCDDLIVGAEEEGEEGDDGTEEVEGAAAEGEGPAGAGRKRRRRRRRRKKGAPGEPGEAAATTPVVAASREAAPREAAPAPRQAIASRAERRPPVVVDEEPEPELVEEFEEQGMASGHHEEDVSGETLRELIATWNVPSWDDIIGGLHRPER